MAQFKAFAPGVQVNGETVLSVVAGVPGSETMAKRILASSGIPDPQAGKWYPQQAWLDAFKNIADEVGPRTLQNIGKAIPENAQWPPQVNSIETALPSIDIAYHMNHRGGDIGTYHYQKTSDRSAKMVCRNPYPCQFDQGIIMSAAKRFKPADIASVNVTHDDSAPCRSKDGDSCTYVVEW